LTDDRVQKLSILVGSARSGDSACLEELSGILHKEIFSMVYHRTGSRMDAEDVTQETFLEMSRKIRQLKDPDRFKSWLYRIALNRVKDFHRKKKLLSLFATTGAVEGTDPTGDSNNPLSQIMEKEFWREFYGFTRQLPRKEREVFLLRYVDQVRIREIAETLKNSESTVKTHLYRALKKFKRASGLRDLLKGSAS